MFQKILIVEDLDTVYHSLIPFLKEMENPQIDVAPYCDEAYVKCKKAALEEQPYDLLICDLSFKNDHRNEKINSGEELSFILKEEFPDIKIIIHSIEDHPTRVKKLLEYVDAYVCKGRSGMKHLKEAILTINKGSTYLSPDLERSLNQSNIKELSEYEITLLKLLSRGYNQEEISAEFQEQGLSPHSKSSIEKKLKDLKDDFSAKTTAQLITIVLSLQLI